MLFVALLLVLGAVGAPACSPTCKMANTSGPEGQCPIELSWDSDNSSGVYSECITFSVWVKNEDLGLSKIRVLTDNEMSFKPIRRGDRTKPENYKDQLVKCGKSLSKPFAQMKCDCVKAGAGRNVSISYSTNSSSCTVFHQVADSFDFSLLPFGTLYNLYGDPVPDFSFSVNKSSKTVSITMVSKDEVYARICHQHTAGSCSALMSSTVSKAAVLNIPHVLPCVCVEVYYNYTDAKRNKKCLFQNDSSIDVRDVWDSSKVELFSSHIKWTYPCPANKMNISASLCWKQHEHLCIPVLNSMLQKKQDEMIFTTTTVDKHPQMCVQFSIQGSHNISCPFRNEKPSWETSIEAGRQSILVHLTSTASATFSAQLCVLTERECTPRGQIYSVVMAKAAGDNKINVPILNVTRRSCVQVWQSGPELKGRRIQCLDNTHNRWGLYPAAVLIFAVLTTLLGFFIYRATKSGAADLLIIQRPLLLVCSSNQSTHISAVFALASILQGELGATVRTSLWAKNSQRQAGNGAGVADLGPLPWLYGQWEAVCKAHGKILIVWSPEAKKTYERRKLELANMDKNMSKKDDYDTANERMREVMLEDINLTGKSKRENSPKSKDNECFDNKDWCSQNEQSPVTELVFEAALASLEGVLQKGKGKEVALVYFQSLCHSRDIPKSFRSVPRYCLPQDFSDLIQELAEVRGRTESGEFRRSCWHRLLFKVMSMWLARQLTQRLQTLLPQT